MRGALLTVQGELRGLPTPFERARHHADQRYDGEPVPGDSGLIAARLIEFDVGGGQLPGGIRGAARGLLMPSPQPSHGWTGWRRRWGCSGMRGICTDLQFQHYDSGWRGWILTQICGLQVLVGLIAKTRLPDDLPIWKV